ncbi:MAG: LEA type 2 family protein [Psychromonas sp.]
MTKPLLAISMLLIISACSSLKDQLSNYVKEPDVTYKSIAMGEVSMDLIQLKPTFTIDNKNDFSIPIDTMDYTLSLNEKTMLTGENVEVGTLPANDTKDVTLSIDLTKETLSSLQQLLFKEKKIDYQVKGSVKAMGLSIPFEKSDTIYVPEVTINDFKVVNASMDKLEILLDVDIDNQNDFSIPLETMSYSVSTGGNALFSGDIKNKEIAKGKNNIVLPLTIKPNDLYSNAFAMLTNPQLPLHFEIKSPLFTKSYDQTLNLGSFL